MSPLDTDEPFSLELMNIDITLRTGKDGPRWRFHADITQDEALLFANANLAGMILEMQGRVAASQEQKPKGGAISKHAGMLCQEPDADKFAVAQNFDDMKQMLYKVCKVTSRAELDHSEEAAKAYEKLKHRYYRWEAQ